MKRLSLAIIFACWTMAMAAQDAIEVRFLGTNPDIVDFAWSLATANDDNEEGDVDESRNAGFEVDYFNTSYSLPRTGKDITVTQWSENGREKWQKTLKWNGSRFSY